MKSRIVHWAQAHAWELGLCALLFVAALAIRLPNLMLVPRYSDEGLEVLWGLDIAQGHQLPLTAVDAYDGPLFAYMIAALFRLLGTSTLLPRLMTASFGALTVVATYWLGRSMADRWAGLIAAGLALTSPLLIVNSHLGWSNSLTPFFCTVTVIALWQGVTRKKGWLLALSGLLAALTLQTHPLSSAALAGMGLWFLFRRDIGAWFKQKATWGALGLFVLGYAPMIIANLRPNSPMLSQGEDRTYALALTTGLGDYGQRLIGLLRHILLIIGDGVPNTVTVLEPLAIVMGGLLLVGLLWAWRRNNGLLATIFIVTSISLPTFVKVFTLPGGDRYILYLAPLGYVAIGMLVADLVTSRFDMPARLAGLWTNWRKVAVAVALVLLAGLVIYPIRTLSVYYAQVFAAGETNQDFFQLRDALQAADACGPRLFLQYTSYPSSKTEAYFTMHSINYVLTLDHCAPRFLDASKIVQRLQRQDGSGWVIAPEPSSKVYAPAFELQTILTIAPYKNAKPGPFVLYHAKQHLARLEPV